MKREIAEVHIYGNRLNGMTGRFKDVSRETKSTIFIVGIFKIVE